MEGSIEKSLNMEGSLKKSWHMETFLEYNCEYGGLSWKVLKNMFALKSFGKSLFSLERY